MTDVATDVVWRGAEALRQFLVPIDSLEPFPGNPRRGDVQSVRESLARFGQVRAVALDAENGHRLIAGHHVVLAAASMAELDPEEFGEQVNWTHVAAIPSEFADAEEARAYVLADNRTHDRGDYDLALLHRQLAAVAQTDTGLVGTGYDDRYLAGLAADLEALRRGETPPDEFPPLDPDSLKTEHRCPSCGYEWSGSSRPGE
jgi:hypothetical protein